MVEAAGVEPASENIPHGHLHAYPEVCVSAIKALPGEVLSSLS